MTEGDNTGKFENFKKRANPFLDGVARSISIFPSRSPRIQQILERNARVSAWETVMNDFAKVGLDLQSVQERFSEAVPQEDFTLEENSIKTFEK